MRAFVAAAVLVTGIAIAPALSTPRVFAATTITEPAGSTVVVTVDGSGKPAPFTVKASGFEPYENVFIEQCNGRPPSAEHWQPTIDCDLGSAPAPAVAGTDGSVTFLATDPNHALHPFVGPSPEGLFNCLPPKGTSPANGMSDFTDCQVRISSSNTAGTDDQVFLTLSLPKVSGASTSAGTSGGSASAGSASGSKHGSGSSQPVKSASASESGTSSSSSLPLAAVALPIVAVVLGGAFFLLHKRRSGRVAA